MATLVTMPKLGLTMTEGVISKWHKLEGDSVTEGELLLEITTDKITNEVEAPGSGILRKILVSEGSTAAVMANVAVIADAQEDISDLVNAGDAGVADERTATRPEEQLHSGQSRAVEKKGAIMASPAAKKYSREHGVDLSLVTGTGPEGVTVEKDVIAFVQNSLKKVKTSPVAARVASEMGVELTAMGKSGRIMKADVMVVAGTTIPAVGARKMAPTAIRKVIAERMAASWHTAPMVTLNIETDATQLIAFRKQLKNASESKGVKLTYNDLLIKICATALMEFPIVNASFDGQEITLHEDANIGLAVAIDGGLVVPNVKAAQTKALAQIAGETNGLVERAKNNRLSMLEMTGGTFTITNLGMFGINDFTPIINPPESAILGVNAMVDRPVVVNGVVAVRTMMNLSLTIDHRIIDGADGARFVQRVKELIENPLLLLL